jgi:hypothetical protein
MARLRYYIHMTTRTKKAAAAIALAIALLGAVQSNSAMPPRPVIARNHR